MFANLLRRSSKRSLNLAPPAFLIILHLHSTRRLPHGDRILLFSYLPRHLLCFVYQMRDLSSRMASSCLPMRVVTQPPCSTFSAPSPLSTLTARCVSFWSKALKRSSLNIGTGLWQSSPQARPGNSRTTSGVTLTSFSSIRWACTSAGEVNRLRITSAAGVTEFCLLALIDGEERATMPRASVIRKLLNKSGELLRKT